MNSNTPGSPRPNAPRVAAADPSVAAAAVDTDVRDAVVGPSAPHPPSALHAAAGPAPAVGADAPEAGFKVFRKLNAPAWRVLAAAKGRIDARALAVFPGDTLEERIVRELAHRRALPVKEVFESFEFHARVRRDLRAPVLADLCAGHGLAGLLFAVYDRVVEEVVLCDARRPANHAAVLEAVCAVAPWVRGKVRWLELPLKQLPARLPPGAALAAVHACGVRTDYGISLALGCRGPLALMPCCYEGTAAAAPPALRRALGVALAADVDRTYRLEAAGFRVRWTAVPQAITPMNRVLIAVPGAAPR